jgi:uncharacterized protein
MYPKPYIDYLVYFHSFRDYFECHEVLEEYWKSASKQNRKKHWVGLIQLAVGLYHQRRDNVDGAEKMLKSAKRIVTQEKEEIAKLGLNVDELIGLITDRIKDIQESKSYYSIQLPINDASLLMQCKARTIEMGGHWGVSSDLTNEYLIHKHTKRDRSDVIQLRLAELKKKKNRS